MFESLILILSGFGAGILGHILGVGGGIIMMPVMVLIFHYPVHIAIPASLVAIIANSANVAANNIKKEIINIPLGLTLGTITVIFAIIGGLISLQIAERYLLILFSVVMVIVSIIYLRDISKNKIQIGNTSAIQTNHLIKTSSYNKANVGSVFDSYYFDAVLNKKIYYKTRKVFLTLLLSALAGLLSSMLGIGGGFIQVPAMNLVSKIPLKAAVATSNFILGLTASSGAIVYMLYGKVDPHLIAMVVVGVYFGSKFSIRYFSKITDNKVKVFFAIMLIAVAIQMFIEAILNGK